MGLNSHNLSKKFLGKLPNIPLKISSVKVGERLCFVGNSTEAQWPNELFNNEAVCRTATAITGKLNYKPCQIKPRNLNLHTFHG